jgi:hypothetical protein
MSDADNRLWGWTASKDNCAFKDAYGLPLYYPEFFNSTAQPVSEMANKGSHRLLPSTATRGLLALVST